jgi:AdoMet-dependent rRNA methyltransferase SPB1
MPMASIKIGIDLDVIKPIKGCVTFQCDITTPRCIALIRKELKHFECDVVMNDGAPNVGTDWNLDAYAQIELSLHAVKLATQVLRKGGTFVTKVFRSRDYNSFLFVLNQLFAKVESSKPPSSRTQSAEIFLVCQGYKAPEYIDPKMLDPKYAFEDIDAALGGIDGNAAESKNVNSLKKLFEQKKPNRSGFADDKIALLYEECELIDFLESEDPFIFLSKFHKVRKNQL